MGHVEGRSGQAGVLLESVGFGAETVRLQGTPSES